MDDVRDLLTRMRNTGVQLSDNDAVAELILGFNQESPKNVSSLSRGASNGLYAQDQPIQLSATDNYENFERELSAFDQWWYNLRQGHAASEQENILPKDRDDDGSGGGQPSSEDEDVAPTQPTEIRADHQPLDNTSSGKSSNALEIRLTDDIRRVGRPKSNRAKLKEKAKVALKEYNKGMKLRGLLRDKDICDVVATILEIKPGVNELGSYLAIMLYKTKTPAKVFRWRVDPDFIPERIRYRLPESVVSDALEKLHSGLAKDEEIEIDSEGEQVPAEDTFVVAIEKVGEFKRVQLEGMQWLWNMQAVCRNAVLCSTWLSRNVKPNVEDPARPQATLLHLLETWPSTAINGFGFDLFYSDLYCLRGDAWLNNNAMRAASAFLREFKNNVIVILPPPPKKKQKQSVPASTLEAITVMNQTLEFVLLPVNLQGVHWGGLVVERPGKKVEVYDSMNGKKNRKQLKRLATEVIKGALVEEEYSIQDVAEPTQKDSNNCGAFVCSFFWSFVSGNEPEDLSDVDITKLRWEILAAILKAKRH
ncbi:hypothetical protein PC128_g21230 [Phytophthora cactorum]|nr:hypothetical protein PC128_g21230 [Phytophthora cactorum]